MKFRSPSFTARLWPLPGHGAWFLLVMLALALCGNVLLSQDRIFAASGTDMEQQFIAWRQFGFAELAMGRLPLWNPYVFAGAPYFGGFQAALLYPLNWPLFLILDTRQAINASVTIHCVLMGVFSYGWLRNAQRSHIAALTGGSIAMFCGTYAAHIYAGHLPNVCAMVWFPLQLLAVDRALPLVKPYGNQFRNTTSAVLIGAVAIAMQILAGHPQYVFVSAIALVVYVTAQGIAVGQVKRAVLAVGAMGLLGAALAAVQLFPGVVANMETVRSRPLPEAFAAMFSLPIENLWTLVLPEVFGGGKLGAYFGRWYLWEVSLYVGWGAVLLAIAGGIGGPGRVARHRALLAMGSVALVLALGDGTPLHHWLYQYIPGFDRIRGVSKFAFACVPALIYLAAQGYDHLSSLGVKRMAWWAAGLSLIIFFLALLAQGQAGHGFVEWLAASRQSYFLERVSPLLQDTAQRHALLNELAQTMSAAFVRGGLELLGWAMLLACLTRKPSWKPLVPALVVLQLLWYAWGTVAFSSYGDIVARWDLPEPTLNSEFRVADHANRNSGLYTGSLDVSGNDPGVATRYAELMAAMEGKSPNQASQYIDVPSPHPLHTLLRLQYVRLTVGPNPKGWLRVQDTPMPRFSLVDSYSLHQGRDAVLARMFEPSFDPRREVVLEEEPSPKPQLGAQGQVQLQACDTDSCTVQVQLDRPALLLITDAWTPSWHAKPASNAVVTQEQYRLLPGDYAFRVVALSAGPHAVTMYYERNALRAGGAISAMAMITVILLMVWCWWPRLGQRRHVAGTP